jgi:uncharacterized protein (DUF2336 family)
MSAEVATVLVAELEDAVRSGSPERRIQMLRQVTDLFLSQPNRLNEEQISVFDTVLLRLIERMESHVLTRLSEAVCESSSAPKGVVRQLAYNQAASVAVPVLSRSSRLDDADLVTIAGRYGPDHLLAVSSRQHLNETITDALIRRGDDQVTLALARNAGAQFSETGYSRLLQSAECDDGLAEQLGLRRDIPVNVLRELLLKASEAVRSRLMNLAPLEIREKIRSMVQSIAAQLGFAIPKAVDYSDAEAAIAALNRSGNLTNSSIRRFALDLDLRRLICSIAVRASVQIEAIEPLFNNERPDGLIVACKAAKLDWDTAAAVLRSNPDRVFVDSETVKARSTFEALSNHAAQRTIRFWSARTFAKKDDGLEWSSPVVRAG